MDITEIRVRLVNNQAERLKGFCSVTFDGEFVVRDLKIIDGPNGPFIAMPSRKLADKCRKCGAKNTLRSRFCNECGVRLKEPHVPRDSAGRAKLHIDVAHPINAACRERLQSAVLKAFQEEEERSKQPGYVPTNLEEEDLEPIAVGERSEYDDMVAELRESALARERAARPSMEPVNEPHATETDVDDSHPPDAQTCPAPTTQLASVAVSTSREPDVAAAPTQSEPETAGEERELSKEEGDFGKGIV